MRAVDSTNTEKTAVVREFSALKLCAGLSHISPVLARYPHPPNRNQPRTCRHLYLRPACLNAGVVCVGNGGIIDLSLPPVVYGGKNAVVNSVRQSVCFNDGWGCGVIDVSLCASSGGIAGSDGATTSDSGVTAADSTVASDNDSSATTSDRALPTTDSGTSTSPSSSTSPCQTEADACRADADCVSCAETLDAEEATVGAICEAGNVDGTAATCSQMSEVSCCYVEEGSDCVVTNAAMMAYIGGS